jgi:hypothetical protein
LGIPALGAGAYHAGAETGKGFTQILDYAGSAFSIRARRSTTTFPLAVSNPYSSPFGPERVPVRRGTRQFGQGNVRAELLELGSCDGGSMSLATSSAASACIPGIT